MPVSERKSVKTESLGAKREDADSSCDSFHRGAFHVLQPLSGHRSGIDAMILAAAVPSSFSGRICDLGAGAGAAGLAVAARCAQAQVALVDNASPLIALARRTLTLESNRALAPRIEVIEADVTARRPQREAAGLADNGFDFAIMNPPFNDARDRQTPDDAKRAAHVMQGDLFADWVRTAAALVKSRGHLAMIARPQSIADILAALDGRFGATRIMPVHARPNEAAIRIVVQAQRASRAPLSFAPALVLHGETGSAFTPQADAINNGRTSLFEQAAAIATGA